MTQKSTNPRPILVISAGNTYPALRETHGDFDDWIATGMGSAAHVTRLDARQVDQALPNPTDIAGVVITGSHAMVTDRAPWSERLAVWLNTCVEANTPVLGICYGHQLLAHAMGGKVDYHPHGMEIGTHTIHLAAAAQSDALFSDMPQTFTAHLVHSQSVVSLPPKASLLASNAHEPVQAYRIGERAWGVQFHPEFDAHIMSAYLDANQHPTHTPNNGASAPASETPAAHTLLKRFHELATSI